jgi:hypothetical protein
VWPDNIKRLYRFIPVLWNDWDFDYSGLYSYIKVKLVALEDCIRYGHFQERGKWADQIKEVIEALDRLIKDEYEEEQFKKGKWSTAAFEEANRKRDSDIAKVFDTIKDNHLNWWD